MKAVTKYLLAIAALLSTQAPLSAYKYNLINNTGRNLYINFFKITGVDLGARKTATLNLTENNWQLAAKVKKDKLGTKCFYWLRPSIRSNGTPLSLNYLGTDGKVLAQEESYEFGCKDSTIVFTEKNGQIYAQEQ